MKVIKIAEAQCYKTVLERKNHINEELGVVSVIKRVVKAIIINIMPIDFDEASQRFVNSKTAKSQ